MSRIRNDLPKYRSQLLKYDLLIYAAQEREEDFSVTSRWSFYVIGAEDRVIAEVNYGWSGITAENSSPTVNELIVCLEDPGLQDIVQEKIDTLYEGYPWLPVLPVRYLAPDEYYEEHLLPHLNGWYDPDTGKIHFFEAFQLANCMPRLESRCGKVEESHYFCGDPLPFVEPEFVGDVCKTCLRTGQQLNIYEPEFSTGSVEVRIHLANGDTCEDVFAQIRDHVERYRQEEIRVQYIHVEIVGAHWSVLLANECAEQVRQFCQQKFPDIESYVIFI